MKLQYVACAVALACSPTLHAATVPSSDLEQRLNTLEARLAAAEERAAAHVGIRGRIVRVERKRASIVTIVSVSQGQETTNTGAQKFYLHFFNAVQRY